MSRKFEATLYTNLAPVVVADRWVIAIRAHERPVEGQRHNLRIALATARTEGHDLLEADWTYVNSQNETRTTTIRAVLNATTTGTPRGPILWTQSAYDMLAEYYTRKGRIRQGVHHILDIMPVYRAS